MNNAAKSLFEANSGCSLAIVGVDGTQFIGWRRGVTDLYILLSENPSLLKGASLADKVVGKGAAALMVVGGVAHVFATVISRPALEMLAQAGVAICYESIVENIINRNHTGICPVESLCLPCVTAEECIPLITNFISNHDV